MEMRRDNSEGLAARGEIGEKWASECVAGKNDNPESIQLMSARMHRNEGSGLGGAMTFDESREEFRKSYAAGRDAYQRVRQDDRRAQITRMVITVLSALLFELLAHYTDCGFPRRFRVCSVSYNPIVQPTAFENWLIGGVTLPFPAFSPKRSGSANGGAVRRCGYGNQSGTEA
jgi:hypothetical protein